MLENTFLSPNDHSERHFGLNDSYDVKILLENGFKFLSEKLNNTSDNDDFVSAIVDFIIVTYSQKNILIDEIQTRSLIYNTINLYTSTAVSINNPFISLNDKRFEIRYDDFIETDIVTYWTNSLNKLAEKSNIDDTEKSRIKLLLEVVKISTGYWLNEFSSKHSCWQDFPLAKSDGYDMSCWLISCINGAVLGMDTISIKTKENRSLQDQYGIMVSVVIGIYISTFGRALFDWQPRKRKSKLALNIETVSSLNYSVNSITNPCSVHGCVLTMANHACGGGGANTSAPGRHCANITDCVATDQCHPQTLTCLTCYNTCQTCQTCAATICHTCQMTQAGTACHVTNPPQGNFPLSDIGLSRCPCPC